MSKRPLQSDAPTIPPLDPPFLHGNRLRREEITEDTAEKARSDAERKIGWAQHGQLNAETVVYPEHREFYEERERSASATAAIATQHVARKANVGQKVIKGGAKGIERRLGSSSQRTARDMACIEWYAERRKEHASDAELLEKQGAGVPMTDGTRRRLTGRTLSRLKRKYREELRALSS